MLSDTNFTIIVGFIFLSCHIYSMALVLLLFRARKQTQPTPLQRQIGTISQANLRYINTPIVVQIAEDYQTAPQGDTAMKRPPAQSTPFLLPNTQDSVDTVPSRIDIHRTRPSKKYRAG
jgi:hypothetical protein